MCVCVLDVPYLYLGSLKGEPPEFIRKIWNYAFQLLDRSKWYNPVRCQKKNTVMPV